MERVDIVINTRNRMSKLRRVLASIPGQFPLVEFNVIIVTDADEATYKALRDEYRVIPVRKHMGSVYCRNLALRFVRDGVIYATDDIEFQSGAIPTAVKAFNKEFPNDNGVVGFNQIGNRAFSKAGVALVGRAFLDRFPSRALFYPGYYHFSCQEVMRAANKLKKFYFAKDAVVKHYNPLLKKDEMDKTHEDARKFRERDARLSKERKRAGLTWGYNDFKIPGRMGYEI